MKKILAISLGINLLVVGLSFAQQNPPTGTTTHLIQVANKICPVSGDKVAGSKMGDKPVNIEYNGKLYHLCCPMCIKDFKKNPEKYSKIAEDNAKNSK